MIQDYVDIPKSNKSSIWFNGKLIPFDEANIHILTHSNNYGTSVFEGVRVYETVKGVSIFHLNEHLDRLFRSADKFGITPKLSKEEILNACIETVKESKHTKGYIRPQIQFGLSSPGLGNTTAVDVSVYFWPLGQYRASDSLNVILSEVERISPKSGDIEAKVSGYYTNSYFNYQHAKKNGADDAIMLDVNGNVAEVSSANIFLVKDGQIITPKTGFILKGITRKSVIEIAKNELGLEVVERIVKPEELASADEIFLTGTAAEIDPVTRFNGNQLGSGNIGEITGKLKSLYAKVTNADLDNYLNWHHFV